MNKTDRKNRLSAAIQATVNAALDAKGLSAREVSNSVVGHDGLIRDIRRGNVPTADKIAGLAEHLDLDFYFGPKRAASSTFSFGEAPLPIIGWARCGTRGDGPTEQDVERTAPAPAGFDQEEAFYAKAKGHSMRPEGIASGDYALIDPSRTPIIGDRVWVKDIKQLASLKRFTKQTDRSLHFRGWLDPTKDGQQSFDIEMPRAAITELYSVVAVFDGPPDGASRPSLRPDPRAIEFGVAAPPSARIAAALDLEEGATEDQIIDRIETLKKAAKSGQRAKEIARKFEQMNAELKTL